VQGNAGGKTMCSVGFLPQKMQAGFLHQASSNAPKHFILEMFLLQAY
jgi:hypothetical protein